MRRVDIPELHERSWFPQSLRDLFTDALQFILNAARIYRAIEEPLTRAVKDSGAERIVDLCSGGAGPWLWLYSCAPVEIVLTDKYPNLAAFDHACLVSGGVIGYSSESVAAERIPPELLGFRTVFNSFHHFPPAEAEAMLREAADRRQGFGAFEPAQRRVLTMLAVAFVPVAALFTAPFIRPFRLSRLFWTYVLPVVPLTLFIDGILSCLRAYSRAELMQICKSVSVPAYRWETGEVRRRMGAITYLLGYPDPAMGCSSRAASDVAPAKN